MNLKSSLKQLSNKMKELENMHPDYKGFAMYSELSQNILKCMLMEYIKHFEEELSIIFIDSENQKIIWYNKPLYLMHRKVLICMDYQLCICIQNNVLFQTNNDIITYIQNFNIFDDEPLCVKNVNNPNLLFSLLYYRSETPNTHNSEKLRLTLGEAIYADMLHNKRTPADISAEFDRYIEDNYEKIIYVMC